MRILSSKRRKIGAGVLVLLMLFLLRPGGSRLKSRIIVSMSSAVGRPVDIGSVHLRLLPRPGFDLQNLVVYDDPAYGAEPMLRAGDVTASLRLTSLLRGRIEIARLDLSDPSLNLVHGDNGRWNLEALLERTAHTPLAPTAKAKLEPRPGFPYIEASSARINFKNGPEKKPFALTNADFSLWQDSENTWGLRLVAQPVRTDLSLNDTGTLRVSGTWQRAPTLRETPLNFSIEWRRAQLGQLTKLFTRADQGWRGGIDLTASLNGTPSKLAVHSAVAVQDFRRYDVNRGEPLRLAAHCDGQYSSLDHAFHEVMCGAPVGSGLIVLKGEAGLPGSHRYGLAVIAENVPATALAALAQHAKKNLPDDLTAAGLLHGTLEIDQTPGSAIRIDGQGEISEFRLASSADRTEFGPQSIPFLFTSGETAPAHSSVQHNRTALRLAGAGVELGPVIIADSHPGGATLEGSLNRSGYNFMVEGEAGVARILRLSRMIGLPTSAAKADGQAQLNLQIAGAWPNWGNSARPDLTGPQVTGTAKLRNVRVSVRGAEEPVEISAAEVRLQPDGVRVEKLAATAAGASWSGSLELPRGCGTPEACEVHFDLKTDRLQLSRVSEWAKPSAKQQPWYRVLETSIPPAPSLFGSLRASGHLRADRFDFHSLAVTRVSASVILDRGKLQVADLQADAFGGSHVGSWQADFTAEPARCHGDGVLRGVQLARLAGPEMAPEMTGTGSATYQIAGPCSAAFWTSAEGSLQFDLQNGELSRISLEDQDPLRFQRFSGLARLLAGKIETKNAALDSSGGKFVVSGTASLQRVLDLKLARSSNAAAGGYSITGKLAAPVVAPLAGAEQARLKPETAK